MSEVKGGLELKGPWNFSYNESGAYAKYENNKDSKYIKMQIEQGLGAYNLPWLPPRIYCQKRDKV